MLTRILDWSLRHRLAVLAGWLAVVVTGIVSAAALPFDAFPDTTPVQVQVHTSAPALGPLEVERQLTRPVELALSGLPGLAEVRSLSRLGFSQITVTFEDGADVYRARQLVAERVAAVELPRGANPPRLGPVATGLGEIFHYLLSSDELSLAELRELQDWVIAPELRAVRGVAEVNSWGGDERQIEVVVDPRELERWKLSIGELAEAIERNNANTAGGLMEQAGEAAVVAGVGLATSSADVEDMVVATRGTVALRVRDVARVREGRAVRRGAVTADGRGEVVLGLAFMLTGENSRDVSERLRARLDEVRATLPAGVRAEVVHDRNTLVDRVLATVEQNLLEGALLVVAVLFAFLGSLRAGLIVAAAIPLSMLFAANLMLRAGIAGSLMSLGAIDFGLLVDSSIIQVENVVRRGEECATATSATAWRELVRDAVVEVRRPTLFGELVIAAVYLPVLTLQGVEGKLFRPMALTVLFALAGSLTSSLTLTPVLASFGFGRRRRAPRGGRLGRLLERGYRPVLRAALERPRMVVGLALVVVAGGAWFASRLGAEFVPRLWEGTIVVNKVELAGVSLGEAVRYGSRIEALLLERFPDEVERVWTRTGSAEIATDPMGVELSDVFVALAPPERWRRARTQAELVGAMASELAVMPGARFVFTQPIEMRVSEMLAGIRADVGVRIVGDDLDVLKQKAREVEGVLRDIAGASDVVAEQMTGAPVIAVEVDRAAAGRLGVEVRDVLDAVEALGGREVGTVFEGERSFPIVLRLAEAYRRDERALAGLLVATPRGERVPLATVAHLTTTEGPAAVQREWGRRRVVVQANVRGRDLGSFVAEARERIEREVALPPGYAIRYGGDFEHLARARDRLYVVVPVALAIVLGLLYATYRRVVDAARVFTGAPFAAVGGVVALHVAELPFTISAAVGFVVLAGVSVLGDMVLVSAVHENLARGLQLDDAVEAAACRRLRPVLMTALVAGVGFLPMALNTGFGAEVQRPLATVVIGGIVSSTTLTLLVLPVLFRFARKRNGAGTS